MHASTRFLIVPSLVCALIFQCVYPISVSAGGTVSKRDPQIMGSPEEDISSYDKEEKKVSRFYLWAGAIVGVALIAALAAGGGGGGGGGDDSQTAGSVDVSW